MDAFVIHTLLAWTQRQPTPVNAPPRTLIIESEDGSSTASSAKSSARYRRFHDAMTQTLHTPQTQYDHVCNRCAIPDETYTGDDGMRTSQ